VGVISLLSLVLLCLRYARKKESPKQAEPEMETGQRFDESSEEVLQMTGRIEAPEIALN
jgi:hypothetical protein